MVDIIDDAASVEVPLAEPACVGDPDRQMLLTGRVGPALMYLAIPVLGEQFLHLMVGLVDTYLAGTVSKEATSAIGLATQVVWLANLLFSFIGVGATALISRHAGMRDRQRTNHFANQAIALAVLMGVMECVIVWTLAPILPWILGWQPEPTRIAVQFLRIDCWSYCIYSLTLIGAACWRGTGDTRTPLYIMCVVNVWNVVASTSLRFGYGPLPQMGVLGIVLGTFSARVLGGSIVFVLLVRGRSGLQLIRRELRYRWDSVRRLLRVGIPAGLDGMLLWLGQFSFLLIISRLGTGEEQAAIVAAHVVGIRVEALSYLPAYAWAMSAATLVGQSLGARNPRRALQSGHLAALQGAVGCFIMSIGYFVFAEQIYALFNASHDSARVSQIGVPALRALAFFQVPLALMIIYTNALRGAGDTRWPLLFTAIGMILVRLPLAYIGGIVLKGGLLGAWTGMFADMTIRATLNTIRFARGKWQHIAV